MADNFGLKIGIEGEKEFKKALSEINQSFKVLGSEMKLVSSQFDKNDKSVQALSARNTVLNKEIEAQKNKVETLRAALRNAADSFGENDRRTQNWQIQLNNAEAALNSMERELSDNERAIEAFSQEETDAADATERLSQEIARQEDALAGMKRAYSNAVLQYGKGSSEAKELEGRISQLSGELRENRERMKDAGDVAEDFGDSLEDASNGADKLGSGLSVATVAMGNLISSGIQAALNGIKELGSAIWNLDEATEEYRVAQGKLTTAFEAAGYSGEAAQKSYNEFYKILGDTDTATEASQLLAQLAQNEQDITKWTNIAAGVYGTFGDALPIEGMIESANETAKVGEVTGSLADALNWVGISEDAFNEKLAACSSESERNRLIMETLSGAYDEASSAFYRNNEALVASREGQAQLDETLAGLGETISNVKNSLRAEFLPAISEVISAFTDMINGVDGADEAFAGAITGLVNTAVSMLPQFVNTGMQMLTSLLSGIIQSLPAVMEGAAQIIVTLAQGIAAAVPTLIPQIVLVVTQIVQTLIENLPMILDAALQLILGLAQGLDDVPDRYFMARLNAAVECERLLRSSGSFDLTFFCPDPFGYAIEDENFSVTAAGSHTITRHTGNMESNPIYRIEGEITSGAGNYISITTNGQELKIVNATLAAGETLVVDTDRMTAYVEDENGTTVRNGLPYLEELNFPTLSVGDNTVSVAAANAVFTGLEIQARSRWR